MLYVPQLLANSCEGFFYTLDRERKAQRTVPCTPGRNGAFHDLPFHLSDKEGGLRVHCGLPMLLTREVLQPGRPAVRPLGRPSKRNGCRNERSARRLISRLRQLSRQLSRRLEASIRKRLDFRVMLADDPIRGLQRRRGDRLDVPRIGARGSLLEG